MENTKNIPDCVGIIMDGNRRFAKAQGLPAFEGHRKGYEKLKEVLKWGKEAGIKHTIVYAFSTENWKRAEEEVGYLIDLFRWVVSSSEIEDMKRHGLRVRFVGEREKFATDLQEGMRKMEEETSRGEKVLWIALSYGGRAEILEAVKKITRQKNRDDIESMNEEDFSQALWTAGMPDPDIVIRTGGEMRLSGFLPWQSVYSELFFTPTLWPEFSKKEFLDILEEFSQRERRRGR